jgi:hypothetical protein
MVFGGTHETGIFKTRDTEKTKIYDKTIRIQYVLWIDKVRTKDKTYIGVSV